MSTIQGSFAGINTVRNVSLIQRSLLKTVRRAPAVIPEIQEPTSELEVSKTMRSQIGSITERIRKLEFLVNRNQATESALGELEAKAKEIREVVVAATDVAANTPEEGRQLQSQFDKLASDFNDKIDRASFGSLKLFNDSHGSIAVVRKMPELDISIPEVAKESLKEVDFELKTLAEAKIEVESKTRSEYEVTVRSLEVASQNVTASESFARDPRVANSQAAYLKSIVQSDVEAAAHAQGPLTSDTVFKLLHA